MGDRANVAILYEWGGCVCFYTHWRGAKLPALIQRALKNRQRWDDDTYLARIIFDTMTHGYSDKFAGFGISPTILDNEYPIIVIDVANQGLFTMPDPCEREPDAAFRKAAEKAKPLHWTFEHVSARDTVLTWDHIS
jgi:hypothetical protein